jgi:hypothetical protein
MNLVTPKAGAKQELLFNKDFSVMNSVAPKDAAKHDLLLNKPAFGCS